MKKVVLKSLEIAHLLNAITVGGVIGYFLGEMLTRIVPLIL